MTIKRVATEDTAYESFWARGADDGYLHRRARAFRWLRRHGRLRGAQITRLRAVLTVTVERTRQSDETAPEAIGTAEATVIRQCLTGDLPAANTKDET